MAMAMRFSVLPVLYISIVLAVLKDKPEFHLAMGLEESKLFYEEFLAKSYESKISMVWSCSSWIVCLGTFRR